MIQFMEFKFNMNRLTKQFFFGVLGFLLLGPGKNGVDRISTCIYKSNLFLYICIFKEKGRL